LSEHPLRAAALLVRKDNWWNSKIPLVLAVAYFQILVQDIAPARAFVLLGALLFSAVCLAAYGHVINDVCDVEADRRAGKPNRIARLSVAARAALLLALLVVGLLPWLAIRLDRTAAACLFFICALPTVYAAPPLRLKERGVWGALADASMAHAVPALFTLALFASQAETRWGLTVPLMVATGAWALGVGLRGIVLHEIWDLDNDLQAGVRTFVARIGRERARRLVTRVIFPAEMAGLCAMSLLLMLAAPSLVVLLPLAFAFEVLEAQLWKTSLDPAPRQPGVHILPHDLYQIWMPLMAAVLLATRHASFLALVALQVVLFLPALRAHSVAYVLEELARRSHRLRDRS
jgi:4-hydroxybenzoate polyprenyltransferase